MVTEKLFALDGQHRLSRVSRRRLERLKTQENTEATAIDWQMKISVIMFVSAAVRQSPSGLRKNVSRLFTTLNKAGQTSERKVTSVALDEDDAAWR